MKKTFSIIALVLLLTACQKNNPQAHENRFDNNPNVRNDIDMYNDEADLPNCFTLCHTKIQELCLDEIVELESDGGVNENSIYNEEACESACMSKWNDDTLLCMGKAKKCESISQEEPYCKEEEDDSAIEYKPEQETNYDCTKACYKYKECAMKADDATQEDGNSAYQTCFEECQNWSVQTVVCVNNTETGTGMGCANLSACALKEYQKFLK